MGVVDDYGVICHDSGAARIRNNLRRIRIIMAISSGKVGSGTNSAYRVSIAMKKSLWGCVISCAARAEVSAVCCFNIVIDINANVTIC